MLHTATMNLHFHTALTEPVLYKHRADTCSWCCFATCSRSISNVSQHYYIRKCSRTRSFNWTPALPSGRNDGYEWPVMCQSHYYIRKCSRTRSFNQTPALPSGRNDGYEWPVTCQSRSEQRWRSNACACCVNSTCASVLPHATRSQSSITCVHTMQQSHCTSENTSHDFKICARLTPYKVSKQRGWKAPQLSKPWVKLSQREGMWRLGWARPIFFGLCTSTFNILNICNVTTLC